MCQTTRWHFEMSTRRDYGSDTPWTNAELLWNVRALPGAEDDLLLVLDRMTGFAGRGLLIPVPGGGAPYP